MNGEQKFEIDDSGDVRFSQAAAEAMAQAGAGDEAEAEPNDEKAAQTHPIYGSKHTYCCKMGNDQERQQFRSYGWQAPLFCMRMAKSKGYNSGSVSRGECKPRGDE